MAASDCIAEIKEAAGRLLTDDDVTAIVEELERRRLSRRGKASLESIEEQMFRDAEELASEIEIAARIEKRNRLINLKRQAERDNIIARFDDPGEALRALNVGTNSPVMGGRMSVDARDKAIESELLGGFIADLRRENLIEVFNSEQKADEIARELWEIRTDGTGRPGITGDRDAQKIAQIISKYQEASRLRMNRAGAAIGKLDGYITKQSHDPVRIRRAGFEAWYKEIVGLLDHERTFQGEDPVKFLQGVYDGLTTGVHLKATGEQSDRMYAFRGPGNLAKRASAERVLHFQSADAWTRYNRDFGTGTFNESVLQGFRHAARTSAVMEVWGTNPEVAWQNTVRDLQAKHRGDPKKMAGIEPGSMKMQLREWEFREVAGMTNIAASRYFASFGSGVRAAQSMAKLGGAVISSVTDVAYQGGEMRFQGESLLSGYYNTLQNVVRGRGSGEQREIADLLGVGIEGMIGSMAARFSASDGVPGVAGKLMHRFFKLNGLSWWTDAHKTGVGLMMARKLAMERRLGWAELSEDRRRVLSLYGIDGARWDLIRQSAVRNADGAEFIVPQGIRDLPDDVLLAHIRKQGELKLGDEIGPRERRMIDRLKDDLTAQLGAYYTDRVDFAVLTPGARERALLKMGTQPGTVEGEALRFIMQFKAFPLTVMTKAFSREIRGRGHADVPGLINFFVASTVLGYVAQSAKEMVKGRNPRDPLSPETWVAAFVQGGGAGIYGDFLFGTKSRFGAGPLDTLMGPTFGTVNDLAGLLEKVREGDDPSAAALRTVISNTPFANLFYLRTAMDYLFLYRIQEAMNPGFLRRFERRVERDNDQTFWLRPSEAVQ